MKPYSTFPHTTFPAQLALSQYHTLYSVNFVIHCTQIMVLPRILIPLSCIPAIRPQQVCSFKPCDLSLKSYPYYYKLTFFQSYHLMLIPS